MHRCRQDKAAAPACMMLQTHCADQKVPFHVFHKIACFGSLMFGCCIKDTDLRRTNSKCWF